jgi:RHH-type proline utilization regulon transcriptional repressor/proline dehydrogenase/delta 1-pyrroline-5-carboxylate dehydrogenase
MPPKAFEVAAIADMRAEIFGPVLYIVRWGSGALSDPHAVIDQIGSVVELQPSGGEGLSGTGPKAGGPHYLYRFCAEQTITGNTTAAAGGTAATRSRPSR